MLSVQVRDGQGIDSERYPARSLTQTCLVAVLIACFVRRERLGRDQGDLAVKATSCVRITEICHDARLSGSSLEDRMPDLESKQELKIDYSAT